MHFGIVVFPGTNCDTDTLWVIRQVLQQPADPVWHEDTDLSSFDAVILPGGFAHGDYLRTGAIARFSPIMSAVKSFADRGGPVLGICNGFQVLLEAGLLPGAMVRNDRIKFVSRLVPVRVEQTDTPFTAACSAKQVLNLPIAHGEGNYYAPPEVLDDIEQNRQVIFRYTNAAGETGREWNPNGSLNSIAGICNRQRNAGLRFVCKDVHLRVENADSRWTRACSPGQRLRMPIAHNEGAYYVDADTLARMNARGQVLLRYCDAEGRVTPEANPNGSVENIAGIANEAGNVFGLMPHPERAAEPVLGSADGRLLFESLLQRAGVN